MYGYIFETTNKNTGETYIGKRYSVKFDKKFFGIDESLIEKYGKDAFTVKMVRAFEEQEVLDYVFNEMMKARKPVKKVEEKKEEPKVEEPKEEVKPRKKRAKATEE